MKNCEYWRFLFSGILWVGSIGTIWAQKIAQKKLMKFTRFIDCLSLNSGIIQAIKTCKFYQSFMCNFLGPNCFDIPNWYTTKLKMKSPSFKFFKCFSHWKKTVTSTDCFEKKGILAPNNKTSLTLCRSLL